MQHDSSVRVNWGTFNFPQIITTIGSAFGIAIIFWTTVASYTASFERVDARLDAMERRAELIEESRAAARVENDRRLEAINLRIERNSSALSDVTASINQVEYRVTVNEQAVVAVNQRLDRVADVIGELREGLAKLNTGIEVLTQRIETAFPGAVPPPRRG